MGQALKKKFITVKENERSDSPESALDPSILQNYIRLRARLIEAFYGDLPFDIFLKRGENSYTKIFHQGNPIDKVILNKYLDKEIKCFYVHNKQKKSFQFYVEKLMERTLTSMTHFSLNTVRTITDEMINIALHEIHLNVDLGPNTLKWAESSLKGCHRILESDFEGLCRIIKNLGARPYQMKHSFMVSIFSILLAKAAGLESERSIHRVGIGGLLHDIGMSRIDPELIDKKDLTPREWKEIKEHPSLGAKMITDIRGVGPEVRMIILQHHEQPNGMGYPNHLNEKEIYYLAKIVGIADVFTSLITTGPHRQEKFSPADALRIMKEDIGRFDQDLLKKFIKMMIPQKSILETIDH
jgi:putative nucleotidyltransferase with HDIG domain